MLIRRFKCYVFGLLMIALFALGLVVGTGVSLLAFLSVRRAKLTSAEAEAASMVQIAKSESDSEAEHQKEIAEEMRSEMFLDF